MEILRSTRGIKIIEESEFESEIQFTIEESLVNDYISLATQYLKSVIHKIELQSNQ